eukprot:gene36591-44388_t
MTKRKYLLFNADDGRPPHMKPCAFFHSPEGCKNGSGCKFSHTLPPDAPAAATPAPAPIPTPAPAPQQPKAAKQAVPVAAAPAPQPVKPIKQEPVASAAGAKRKHEDNHAASASNGNVQSTQSSGPSSGSKKAKGDKVGQRSEIEELREQMRKQQELFEMKLASLAPAAVQQQQPIQNAYVPAMQLQAPPGFVQIAPIQATAPAHIPQHTAPVQHYAPPQAPQSHAQQVSQLLVPETKTPQKNANPNRHPLANPPAADKPLPSIFSAHANTMGALPLPTIPLPTSAHQEGGKHKKRDVPQPPAVPVAPAPVVAAAQSSSTQRDDSSDDEGFVFGVVNHVLQAPLSPPVPAVPATQSFVQFNMPAAAAFPTSQPAAYPASTRTSAPPTTASAAFPTHAATFNPQPDPSPPATPNPVRKPKGFRAPVGLDENSIFVPPDPVILKSGGDAKSAAPAAQFDVSTVDLPSVDWNKLVQTTQAHHRFSFDYTFKKDALWVQAKKASGAVAAGVGISSPPFRVLALDCEMCECTDPVDGKKDKNALIRLSVVNGLDPNQVLIDTLVAPSLLISDCRTRIHGISEEQLAGVKVSLRHAQAGLLTLMDENTILIGHSICNDLDALKLDHKTVIDTAYLCPLEYEHHSLMGLRALIERLMGFKLPETHDSVQDAKGALFLAAYVGINGPPSNLMMNIEGPQILVHRIPPQCTEEMLYDMLLAYTHVVPMKISKIAFNKEKEGDEAVGKAYVTYATPQHLDLVFEVLPGVAKMDKMNRPTKRVNLKNKKGYVSIRR